MPASGRQADNATVNCSLKQTHEMVGTESQRSSRRRSAAPVAIAAELPSNDDEGEEAPESRAPHVLSLEGIVNAGSAQPKPHIGGHDESVFKPKVLRADDKNRSTTAEGDESHVSRLQPSGIKWPNRVAQEGARDVKRQRVEPLGFTPSFAPLCGAITGVPFYSGCAMPVGQKEHTACVQPMWPDPEMLRKLEEQGSLTQSPKKAVSVKEFDELKGKVARLEALVEKLQAERSPSNKQITKPLTKKANMVVERVD